ncbi:MAG: hypothetical protein IMZ54_02400 [Acidobacteria bacterium]|nr:hypothetical protein [Spirochaetota bacterium]MBE3129553.1 hypothetical protein [Acidobacteriota bacterium]
MKKMLCILFGHKPDNSNIADFTCRRCAEHFKVEWPRPAKK